MKDILKQRFINKVKVTMFENVYACGVNDDYDAPKHKHSRA